MSSDTESAIARPNSTTLVEANGAVKPSDGSGGQASGTNDCSEANPPVIRTQFNEANPRVIWTQFNVRFMFPMRATPPELFSDRNHGTFWKVVASNLAGF